MSHDGSGVLLVWELHQLYHSPLAFMLLYPRAYAPYTIMI